MAVQVQVGSPIATLNESVPGHFTVTGAASIHEALADVGAADDLAYISSDGVWSGQRPYVTLQLAPILRPHINATWARYYLRARVTGTGGWGTNVQIQLIDQVTKPWARVMTSFVIQQVAGWQLFEFTIAPAWLRGHEFGLRDTEDLGLRIWAPGGVLSGTPNVDITVAVVEIEHKYPFSGVTPQWGVRNLGGGNFGNVDYLGLVGAIGQVYTTETQSSTPLTANTAIQAACQRAFYTLPEGTEIIVDLEPGCINMCPSTKLQVQGGSGPTFIWARGVGTVGHSGPFRKVDKLLIRSVNPSNTGRSQISTPSLSMTQNNQHLPWGFVGFENIRFWKFNSDRAIESIFDDHNVNAMLGAYNCHHDGSYGGSSNPYNYRMGARLGYHGHDFCDGLYAWAQEHAGPYSGSMPRAQQLRCRMTFSLDFNPNHPDAVALNATGLFKGKAVNDIAQIVGRTNTCDASGAGPPGMGVYLFEKNIAQNVTSGTTVSIAGHLGGVIFRDSKFLECGSGCILAWTSSAISQSGQHHGFQANIGQFDGPKTSPPFVDCNGTGRFPHGSWPGHRGVAYTNGPITVEDCLFEQKPSSNTVPLRFSGCQDVLMRRNDTTALTKIPIVWVEEWGQAGNGVSHFSLPSQGFCGPVQTHAFRFEGYGANVAASTYWSASTRAAGAQMAYGARDNPLKPQGPGIAIPLMTAVQLNKLSIDGGPQAPGSFPAWPQRSEPTSGVWVQNRTFFIGLKPPTVWKTRQIEYPTPYLEEPMAQEAEDYAFAPVLVLDGSHQFSAGQSFRSEDYVGAPTFVTVAANTFVAPHLFRSESYVRPPRLTHVALVQEFEAPPLFRSESYVGAPVLVALSNEFEAGPQLRSESYVGAPAITQGEILIGVFQANYQARSEHYAVAPYIQSVVPSVVDPTDLLVMPATDIALFVDGEGADIRLLGGDVVRDHGLRTAVLLSLFSDARARPDDGIPGQFDLERASTALRRDLRGWWSEPSFGSKLWLLQRAKMTPSTIESAKQWVAESLAWLVEREFAERVEVEVAVARTRDRIEIQVKVVRGKAKAGGSFWKEGLEELVEGGLALRVLFS